MGNLDRIETVADIQRGVVMGADNWADFGSVVIKRSSELLLFNYATAAQFAGVWTPFERMSRGLIVRTDGEIVARPFDKFFNWLEGGMRGTGHIVTVTEKIDGSLGILYRSDGYKFATRGSFDSEQALWATDFLNRHYDLRSLPDEWTLLFEIVYPGNRVVVDYGDVEALYLLAIRNRFTGDYLPFWPDVYEAAQAFGFPLPNVFTFNRIEDILAATGQIDASREGWVVEMSDGTRWKFKGDRYRELHKLVTGLSFKVVLTACSEQRGAALLNQIPVEFQGQCADWVEEIETTVARALDEIERAYSSAPKGERKEFALWVMNEHKAIAPYLFARHDNKDVRGLVYRGAFRDRAVESE